MDGTLNQTVAASAFRQDLLNAGIGDGNHSFQIATPSAAIDGKSHSITIVFSGTQQGLNNTPKTVSCIAPGVPTPQYNGYHDVGDCSTVAGWAWDANQPTTPISVDIYVDGVVNQTVAASQFRQDLLNAGIGDGNHSFQIATPPAAIDGKAHTITIKFAGTQQSLNTTPKTVSCTAPGVPTPQYNGYHDVGNCSIIAGWAWDANQPNTPIAVDVYADGALLAANVPASNFRQDLLDAGIGNGVHAFQIATPNSLKNNQAHTILVAFAGTQINLNTTPKSVTCAAAAAGTMYFIEVDHLDTPRLIADSAGTTVWRNDNTEPFGDSVSDENPSDLGIFEFPIRLSRAYLDSETQNAYTYFRDYTPGLGRFLESDPAGIAAALNTYAYVDSDPLQYADPVGLAKAPKGRWAECKGGDMEYCRQQCGDRGVKSCRHWWSKWTEVMGGERVEGWKAAPYPSCNCNEAAACGGTCKTTLVLLGMGVVAACIVQPELVPIVVIGGGAVGAAAR